MLLYKIGTAEHKFAMLYICWIETTHVGVMSSKVNFK